MMIWKPSSNQRKKMNTPTEDHTIHHHKLKQEPHLSTLVKHLTTSIKPKDSFNQDQHTSNMQQQSPPPPSSPPQPPSPPPHKKQVRRRRHTSKPYQQRLLNMAEARREIVTALKFHRATMKHRETAGNHRLPEQSPSTTTATADLSSSYLEHYSSLSCSTSAPRHWPMTTATPPPLPPPVNQENLDFTLPDQTLGLNLNFQDFENLGTINLYHNPLSNHPTSSSSTSTSSSTTTSSSSSRTTSSSSSSNGAITNVGLHHAMDDEKMEEIRSLGEQHQIEWNDTVNLLMSARWFEFLNTIEIEQEDGRLFDDEINPFDQVMEFPPCMDIGEIEGMDGEWLA